MGWVCPGGSLFNEAEPARTTSESPCDGDWAALPTHSCVAGRDQPFFGRMGATATMAQVTSDPTKHTSVSTCFNNPKVVSSLGGRQYKARSQRTEQRWHG